MEGAREEGDEEEVVVAAYRRAGGGRERIGGGFVGGRWEASGKINRSITEAVAISRRVVD